PQEPPQRLALLDGGAAREAEVAAGGGKLAQPGDVRRHGGLVGVERPPAVGQRKDVEEREAREALVVTLRGSRRPLQPSPPLPAPGRRDPVEEAAGPPARSEPREEDPSPPAEAGEGRIDLGEPGAPRGRDLLAQRASEVVSGARLLLQETEEDVVERHA